MLGPPARRVGVPKRDTWRKKITSGRRRAVRKRSNEIKWSKMTGKS